MRYYFLVFIFIISTLVPGISQLPTTEIFLFDYKIKGDSMVLSDAKYLTGFNPEGYNNQPYFFSYSDLYLTTHNKEQDQTDIIHLDLSNNKLFEVTNTKESEYSPTPMPGKRFLSCIRVLDNDQSSQLLWKYPINQSNRGSAIFKNIENVGYHFWFSRTKVAMFLVGPPHKLAIGDSETKDNRLILENIGRTFKAGKGGKLLFIHILGENNAYIKEYDPNLNRATVVAPTLNGNEDFDVLDDGTLISGEGSDIYRFVPGESTKWELVASLKKFGIKKISRINSYFDRIALVNSPE